MQNILITGANGEVGHGLINVLKSQKPESDIIALDLNDLDQNLQNYVKVFIKGSVTDKPLIEKIFSEHKIDIIFHLAAVLSTSGEKHPEIAHEVNTGGTHNLLSIANAVSSRDKRVIKFIFPSTIAVYGIPDLKTKKRKSKVNENEYLNPITMYGVNKLYCENLGVYYSKYYSLLSADNHHYLDFRCIRFPGLISSDTIPSGGTSDYAPEMLHSAAQNKKYKCFVRPDSIIHFMTMPDAIRALIKLSMAEKSKLRTSIYNISGFSASAKDIENIIKRYFPKSEITYLIDSARQRIIDSWSEDVDDFQAQKDWRWKPDYNFQKAFDEYLIPAIKRRYKLT